MTDTYNMKNVFSCSDFLSDLWQGGLDGTEPLDPLANACSSEGGTLLGGGRSTDLLSLLGQTEDVDCRMMRSMAASSTNRQDSPGGRPLTREPAESNLISNGMSEPHRMLSAPSLDQCSPSFHQYDGPTLQLQPVSSTSSGQGGFHIDSSTQGKAICNDDMSVTALQQQLSEMKNKASGLESLLASGMQRAASPSVPAAHHAANTTGTLDSLTSQVPMPAPTPTPTAAPQPQLSLQESQLRQLASLLGSANMAALQSMTLPAAAPSMPGINSRGHSEQPSGNARWQDHSSGDDDTGALPKLHNLSSFEDSHGDHENERSWEAKLDRSLPPPEMKRMRRMLSNRESARRSRRRKQAHMRDLEVQNNELVEANQKLQKELNALRSLAKEAIMEKKKSQTALETLKHQVVHLLGQHDMVPKQGSPTHASQGTDSDASGSGRLEVNMPVSGAGTLQVCPGNPEGSGVSRKQAGAQKPARSPKIGVSPKIGAKRKSLEVAGSPEHGCKKNCVEL
ncbi:hypothetical protein ABBQ38_015201 [Trebouxia sp. C0009 RCD-2024]